MHPLQSLTRSLYSISTHPPTTSVVSPSNIIKKTSPTRCGLHEVTLGEATLLLCRGKIGVIRTDTLYGILASAQHTKAVARVYAVKKRSLSKPFLVLIAHWRELCHFGIHLTAQQKRFTQTYWPGPTTLVFDVGDATKVKQWKHVHRGTNAIAFRVPKNTALINILRITGPLIAPSANIEGEDPASTITEVEAVFGTAVDFYVNGGRVKRKRPSRIYKVSDSDLKRLR